MKIVIFANLKFPNSLDVALKIKKLLMNHKIFAEKGLAEKINVPEMIPNEEYDLAISIGGDGTILRVINSVCAPILGINTGKVGFLTEISYTEIDSLPELIKNCKKEKVSLLDVYISDRKLRNAVNEVAILTSTPARTISLEISVDDEILYNVEGDGIIVSTPTGSTAYALSAGGSIVEPSIDALLVVPLNQHRSTFKPIVFDKNRTIRIKVSSKEKKAIVIVDGQQYDYANPREVVTVKISNKKAVFLRRKSYITRLKDFFRFP